METIQKQKEYTIEFDMKNLKDTVVHQIAIHILENWTDVEVLKLFMNTEYFFTPEDIGKAAKLKQLYNIQKSNLNYQIVKSYLP